MPKLIDLSMPVHNDMVSFPRVVRPALVMYETWQQFAERVGAAKFGVDWLTAHCLIVIGDHIGTHIGFAASYARQAPGPGGNSARVLLRRRRSASISATCRKARASR